MSSSTEDFSRHKFELEARKEREADNDIERLRGTAPLPEKSDDIIPNPRKPFAIVQELPDWRNLKCGL